ncbi:MAG: hypothetical protein K0U82_08685 [Planctomycetes bacterium]|nr:hypothetical protein [Planctomycetota bacterium]
MESPGGRLGDVTVDVDLLTASTVSPFYRVTVPEQKSESEKQKNQPEKNVTFQAGFNNVPDSLLL